MDWFERQYNKQIKNTNIQPYVLTRLGTLGESERERERERERESGRTLVSAFVLRLGALFEYTRFFYISSFFLD